MNDPKMKDSSFLFEVLGVITFALTLVFVAFLATTQAGKL